MASRVQLYGPQEAEKYVLHMVSVFLSSEVTKWSFVLVKVIGVRHGRRRGGGRSSSGTTVSDPSASSQLQFSWDVCTCVPHSRVLRTFLVITARECCS